MVIGDLSSKRGATHGRQCSCAGSTRVLIEDVNGPFPRMYLLHPAIQVEALRALPRPIMVNNLRVHCDFQPALAMPGTTMQHFVSGMCEFSYCSASDARKSVSFAALQSSYSVGI